jgi:hypothetical protein
MPRASGPSPWRPSFAAGGRSLPVTDREFGLTSQAEPIHGAVPKILPVVRLGDLIERRPR